MYPDICCSCHSRHNIASDARWRLPLNLESIDSEILRIEGAIVHLVKRRATLKRHRNTFSRVINLPPEILSLIFEFACLPSSTGDFARSSDMENHSTCVLGLTIGIGAISPLFLGSVCSAWRTVAFSTTQLWNTLKIYVGKKDTEGQANLLRDWLSRSGHRPLSIKVIEEEVGYSNEEDSSSSNWGIDVTSTAVIDILVSHSNHWHEMDLFLPSTWKKALTRIRLDLPILAKITLRGAHFSPSMARVNAFALAPELREVNLINTYLLSDVDLPWGQLHHLQGDAFDQADCLRAVQLCPDLRSCEFERLCQSVVPPPIVSVQHNYLETLILSTERSVNVAAILGSITLPALKELVLSIPPDGHLLDGVVSLVHRSKCRITRLHLVGTMPPENLLIEALQEIPTLEQLLLLNPMPETGGALTHKFLWCMAPIEAKFQPTSGHDHDPATADPVPFAPYFLPKLQSLEYQGAIGFTSRDLVQFLHSRSRPVGVLPRESYPQISEISRLNSLILTTTKRITFQASDSIIVRSLVANGMDLRFSVECINVDDNSEIGW